MHICKRIFYTFLFFVITETLHSQVANNDFFTTPPGEVTTVYPLWNDSGCANYSLTIVTSPRDGTLSPPNADGSFTYKPNADFIGKDSARYSISCNGNSSTAWMFFIVTDYPDNIFSADCYQPASNIEWKLAEKVLCQFHDKKGETESSFGQLYTILDGGDIAIVYALLQKDLVNNVVQTQYFLTDNKHSEPLIFPGNGPHNAYSIAAADVEESGYVSIVIYLKDGNLIWHKFKGQGTPYPLAWETKQPIENLDIEAVPQIADIDGNGSPEVLVLNKIYSLSWLLVTLPEIVGGQTVNRPVMVDVDRDGILEVVGGNKVLKVNITNGLSETENSAFVWKTLSLPQASDGLTSVADIDLDGYPDVVVSSPSGLYAWSPYSGEGSSPRLLGHVPINAVSQALLSDIDNDGYPEIVAMTPSQMIAYKYNAVSGGLTELWRRNVHNSLLRVTPIAFDFEQDEYPEIVYQDSIGLYILDGKSSAVKSFSVFNATNNYSQPIIVDWSGDGHAEILATGKVDGIGSAIKVFSNASGDPWAPTRRVWNQQGYHVVNINNDYTIPYYHFNPATPLYDRNVPPFARRPFNNFLQQATLIDQTGKPATPAADVLWDSTFLEISNTCTAFHIHLKMRNQGSIALYAPFKIAIYAEQQGGKVIKTFKIEDTLNVGEERDVHLEITSGDLSAFVPVINLVMVLNDAGNGVAHTGRKQPECIITNNVKTIPFSLFIHDSLSDFHTYLEPVICQGEVYNENGFDIPPELTAKPDTIIRQQFLKSVLGCDSTVYLELKVMPVSPGVQISDKECFEYFWNGIRYDQSGTYQQNLQNIWGCDSTVTLDLIIINPFLEIEITDDDFCAEYQSVIKVNTNMDAVTWNTGSTDLQIMAQKPGTYEVIGKKDICTLSDRITIEPCVYNFYLPNTITPGNQDGVNDYFTFPVTSSSQILEFEIGIYNRWGMLVFYSKNVNFQWDGSFKGERTLNSVYTYLIKFRTRDGKSKMLKGEITVL